MSEFAETKETGTIIQDEINHEMNEVNNLLESMDIASAYWVGESTLNSQMLQKKLKFQSYQTRRSRPKK